MSAEMEMTNDIAETAEAEMKYEMKKKVIFILYSEEEYRESISENENIYWNVKSVATAWKAAIVAKLKIFERRLWSNNKQSEENGIIEEEDDIVEKKMAEMKWRNINRRKRRHRRNWSENIRRWKLKEERKPVAENRLQNGASAKAEIGRKAIMKMKTSMKKINEIINQ